jgi:hypothetical protein
MVRDGCLFVIFSSDILITEQYNFSYPDRRKHTYTHDTGSSQRSRWRVSTYSTVTYCVFDLVDRDKIALNVNADEAAVLGKAECHSLFALNETCH